MGYYGIILAVIMVIYSVFAANRKCTNILNTTKQKTLGLNSLYMYRVKSTHLHQLLSVLGDSPASATPWSQSLRQS
jgi:hypothetical protein